MGTSRSAGTSVLARRMFPRRGRYPKEFKGRRGPGRPRLDSGSPRLLDEHRSIDAVRKSLFSLLQKNVLNRRTWQTREELRIAIVTWIERPTTAAGVRTASAD